MVIREANSIDTDYIMKYGLNSPKFKVNKESDGFWSKKQILNIINSHNILLVAENHEGEIVGFIICLLNKAVGKATIENIFVDDSFRNKGIASDLIKALLKKINKENYSNICGLVEEQNEPSIKLFEKTGFNKGKKYYWMDISI